MKKPSDTLKKAVAEVEAGHWGLYSAVEDRRTEKFIDAVLQEEHFFWPTQEHRATILALAYTLAKEAGQ